MFKDHELSLKCFGEPLSNRREKSYGSYIPSPVPMVPASKQTLQPVAAPKVQLLAQGGCAGLGLL